MPYSESEKKLKAHHWVAHTGKWNEERRWDHMSLNNAPCTIWYVGGNINGEDGVRLQKEYNCEIYVFEPVPPYYEELKRNYKNVPRSHVLGYGLGAYTRIVKDVHLDGQSTFAMEGGKKVDDNGQFVDLPIRSVDEVYKDLSPTGGIIDLLHVNCEGCEWEMFESLVNNNLINKFRIIQFSAHYYFEDDPETIAKTQQRYCAITSSLSKMHKVVYQQPFGWERWEIPNAQKTEVIFIIIHLVD